MRASRLRAVQGLLGADDDRGGAIGDAGRVAGGDRSAVGLEGRLQLRQRLGAGVGAWSLVGRDHGVALLAGDGDRHDLLVEAACLLGGDRALVRSEGERVLRFAADVVLGSDALGVHAHVHVAGRAPQAVVDGRVDDGAVAEPVAGARLRQQVGRHVHALHAAGHDEVGVAGTNGRCAHHHRLQPGAADLVDGRGADALRQAGPQGSLAGRRLADARLEDLAHDRLVDILRGDPSALHGGADGSGAQLDGRRGGQPATELADRRPGGGENVDVTHARMVRRIS